MTSRAGGATATTTATPEQIIIQPGNGQEVVCTDFGTPYNPDIAFNAQTSTCTYTYEHNSAGVGDGDAYTMAVTIRWHAVWKGSNNDSGNLGYVITQTSFPVRVAEAQALN